MGRLSWKLIQSALSQQVAGTAERAQTNAPPSHEGGVKV